MMNQTPTLSIVTPTLGTFSAYWLEQLLNVQGQVEFILVYPAGFVTKAISDPRVKTIVSPYKGEMMQRFVGLLNATGTYVLALDDDDYVHPDVVQLTTDYFTRFPDSSILRLNKAVIDRTEDDRIKSDWKPIPDLTQLDVCKSYENGQFKGLLEVPIAPLSDRFQLSYLVVPFKKKGLHFENFNNIIWKTSVVQKALPVLSQATKLLGVITWIPMSGFDRLLGLFVQADSFSSHTVIGHLVPEPEQIRYIDKDPALKPPRFHVLSDVLLVKQFPQYGYFWSLFFSKLYGVPRTTLKLLKWKLIKHK